MSEPPAGAPDRCPVCAGTDLAYRLHKGPFSIWECSACRVRFWPHEAGELRAVEIYGDAYFTEGGSGYSDYAGDEHVHRLRARWYLARLAKSGLRAGSLFDVGCAAGFFLDEASRAGWKVAGSEVNRTMAAAASERVRGSVHQGDFLEQTLEPESLDGFTLFNVLEHLPSQPAVVRKMHDALQPGGWVAVETWDYRALTARLFGSRWHQYSPPTVLTFHTERSLSRLFRASEWERTSYGVGPKPISLRHAASALWNALLRTERPAPTWLRHLWLPYLGTDLVFALFRKRS